MLKNEFFDIICTQSQENSFAINWTSVVAFSAFILSLVTAYIQISVHHQELRPYLSFYGSSGKVRINQQTGDASIDIFLNFKNAGKCVLQYNITQLDYFIQGIKQPNVDEKSKGSIIGVNSECSFNRYYSKIWTYPIGLKPEEYILPNQKIIFTVEYYRIDKPKRSISYFMNYSSNLKKGLEESFLVETYAN